MAKKGKVSSREVGLDIGLAVGRFFLNTGDLHYGYWPNGEGATVQNFAQAQENHSKLIMDHIPEGINRILDVGSGKLALRTHTRLESAVDEGERLLHPAIRRSRGIEVVRKGTGGRSGRNS